MMRRILLLLLVAASFTSAALGQSCPQGASWCSGTYGYDGAGNIRSIGSDVYIYDTAGRLVSGTAGGVQNQQIYSYDALGNRTGASRIAGSIDCLGGCELSPPIDTNTNHISGAQYDDAGNLTVIQSVVGSTTYTATYTYDTAGRLARAVAGSDVRDFIYTADDERIATANGASWTWTIRGLDGKVLREFTSMVQNGLPTANRFWAKDYVWRDGLLLASVTPTNAGTVTPTLTQHFHLDHLGTPRLVTGDSGVQLGLHTYYPFGAELNLGTNEQPYELMKFTGHERDVLGNDPHTLDDMHARYYNPTAGRFLSVDPKLGNPRTPQSWNRYVYVGNNPIGHSDPTGQCTDSIVCLNYGRGAFEVSEQITVTAKAAPPPQTFADSFVLNQEIATQKIIDSNPNLASQMQSGRAEETYPQMLVAFPLAQAATRGVAMEAWSSGFGDLTRGEVKAIQGVVNTAERPLDVVGSAARGARGSGSDIDYVAGPRVIDRLQPFRGQLPEIDPHGIIPGHGNPFIGPYIRFYPGETPEFIPMQP